jgi:CRP/FNR family cyclic AMP-dependent transcriptional regulator
VGACGYFNHRFPGKDQGEIEGMSATARRAAERKKSSSRPRGRRRTKGPSEKIRSLAAISLANKVAYLKLSDLTGPENEKAQAFISQTLPKRTFKKGEVIRPPAQKGPSLSLVISGRVELSRTAASGTEFDIKSVEPGTLFGDVPSLGQALFGARATAAETSKIAFISESDFDRLCSISPAIALNALKRVGPRLAEAERKHEQSQFQPVTSRIAALFLRLANQDNQVVGYTHQEMAETLGCYRETVTNAIAELKQDKLVKVGRKRITLLDPEALRRLEMV